MTTDELDAVEARAGERAQSTAAVLAVDVRTLVAEVKRLREALADFSGATE